MTFGQLITEKKDDIVRLWLEQVECSDAIESTQELTHAGVLDSLPELLDAIAYILSHSDPADIQAILRTRKVHGKLRSQKGYDAAEIAREYAILRSVLFSIMEPALLQSNAMLLLRTVRLVDGILDRVIALSLSRYTEERLQEVNLLYDEMLASNQELDRLVRNEQTNLAHLAHELKSPLSCIIGYSDLFLRQRSAGNEPRLSFIEQVLSSGRQLLEIVNETLEISSYQAGKVVLEVTPVDVCALVEEVALVMDTLAQQKGLCVVIDCPVMKESITTDRKRLRQVVTNLISNAVKYTEAGTIRVSVGTVQRQIVQNQAVQNQAVNSQTAKSRADRQVEIEIADTGLGIELEEQGRIFEPFYQGKAGQMLPSSTGLGLAIAHQMVKMLQGDIQLTSEAGVGSTFTITLPLNLSPRESAAADFDAADFDAALASDSAELL